MTSETLETEKSNDGEEEERSKEQEASEVTEKEVTEENDEPEEVGSPHEEDNEEEEEKVEESKKRGRGRKSSSKIEGDEPKTVTPRKRRATSCVEPVISIDRPTRERKTVDRYSEPSVEKFSASKVLSIEKGSGTQLKDIPNVAFKLSKRKPDENLHMLHTILFGKRTKVYSLKRNINQFSGFVWVENEEKQRNKVKERLDKCIKEKLLDFCDILDIPVAKSTNKKEELSAKLLEFLESPHATTEISLVEKEQKGKKRRRRSSTTTETASKKQSPEVKKKRNLSTKVEDVEAAESAETGAESDESDDNEETVQKEVSDQEASSSEEEDKAKAQPALKKSFVKKSAKQGSKTMVEKASNTKSEKSPAESSKGSSASKKGSVPDESKGLANKKKKEDERKSQKNQNASSKDEVVSNKRPTKSVGKPSSREQGKGKANVKPKAEPSREELHTAVTELLEEVDFNTATLSDILRQLGINFDQNLMHRKTEVKSIIEDVIQSMTDEEDEEDEEADPKEETEEEKTEGEEAKGEEPSRDNDQEAANDSEEEDADKGSDS